MEGVTHAVTLKALVPVLCHQLAHVFLPQKFDASLCKFLLIYSYIFYCLMLPSGVINNDRPSSFCAKSKLVQQTWLTINAR